MMTENKRYTFDIDNENGYDEEPYFCNGIDSFYVNNEDEMELFIKQINELHEEKCECENEIARLQMIITKLKDKDYDNYTKKIQKLSKENNELKTTNAELEDYTARIEEELMNIRAENTKNKLILKDVVEDLEKQSNSNEPIIIRKDYVAWIKKNANLNL